MLPTLKGANALLTGGSQGIGPHIARALAKEGVNVALVARSADKLEQVAREIAALGVKAVALPADLMATGDYPQLVQRAEAALGPLDILLNNAGFEGGGSFTRKEPAELERVIQTNVTAPILLTRAVLPGMLARRRGHVVTIASVAGKLGYPYAATYSGTKAAVIAWSNSLRVELLDTGVSCSVVSPGYIEGEGMFANHGAKTPAALGASQPAEVAAGVLRALKQGQNDVIVAPRPVRFLQILSLLAPNLLLQIMKRQGFFDFSRKMLDKE